jgi:zinc/manganese transport system substrate-binding protein
VIATLALAVSIVAAENFYGDVARQIGGPSVQVTSVLRNPDTDPHLFEASPSVARAISGAQIVVYNGVGYDPWVDKLLSTTKRRNRTTIAVAALAGKRPGDNPHVWYDPATMLAYAKTLAADLDRIDPAGRAGYDANLARFESSLAPIQQKIGALRSRLSGTPVLVTEPIADYLLGALGMRILDPRFATAVMNNTEPGAVEVAAFENDLKANRARMLLYNSQASDPVAQRMLQLARAAHVPVVGATETEPPGKSYQAWIASMLDAIAKAV